MMRMPAEWEPHEATWIAWPHHEPDWPGKFDAIRWDYAEIVRALAASERVEILCASAEVEADAVEALTAHGVARAAYRTHPVATDRSWLRDSAPTGVDQGLIRWHFNAWAKYDNYALDAKVPVAVAGITGRPLIEPRRPDTGGPVVMEGGALDVNGEGVILVTEECLLSDVQVRNPGLSREGYEDVFRQYLGARQTLWLGASCVGDDTHGHVDDVARFVGPDTIVLAFESDPADANYEASVDNLRRLELAGGNDDVLRIVRLPFPRPVVMDGQRLPASYANFYIANTKVLVPTFNDPADRVALNTLAELFPDREVVGIHAVDLVWGFGTLHCLTQQQPK
ncbi:MAG TPA: agmatine deiminase family protein [Gemmatimonadaceae bacterium]|nr:agmatine deiminase family protein [Gemmatimonadaceae bacterium]